MKLSLISLLCLFVHTNTVNALEFNYGLVLEAGSSTNITQIATPVRDEFSEIVRGSFNVNEDAVDIKAQVNLTTEVTNYRNDIEDDFNQSDLFVNVLWTLSPNHYEWYFQDIYTHTAVDLFLTNTASNRQYVNALTTGPNFIWRFGKTDNLQMRPRIEDFKYQSSTLNNRRYSAVLEWVHTPSKNSTYILSNKYENTRYTDPNIDNSDFDEFDIDLLFSYTNNKNTLEISSGIAKIESTSFGNESNPKYKIELNNQRTKTSSINLEASKEVTDTSRSITSNDTSDIDLLTTSNDLFVNQNLQLNYIKTFRESELLLGASKGKEEYFLQNILDRNIASKYLQARWLNTRNSVFRLQYSIRESIYSEIITSNRIDNDIYGLIDYTYRSNKNINYIIRVISIERDSTNSDDSFTDKRLLFSIEYSTRNRNS